MKAIIPMRAKMFLFLGLAGLAMMMQGGLPASGAGSQAAADQGDISAPEVKKGCMNGKASGALFEECEVSVSEGMDDKGHDTFSIEGISCSGITCTSRKDGSGYACYQGFGAYKYSMGSYELPVSCNFTIYKFAGTEGKALYRVNVAIAHAKFTTCSFGGKKHGVCVFGNAAPLKTRYNKETDKVDNADQWGQLVGDAILIDTGSETFNRPVLAQFSGGLVYVDKKWYRIAATAGGASISAEPQDMAGGTLKVNNKHWSALLLGTTGVHVINDAGKDPVHVPPDTYIVAMYGEVLLNPDTGKSASFRTGNFVMRNIEDPKPKPFQVAEGRKTVLQIGSPLSAYSTCANGRFVLSICDAAGSKVWSHCGPDGRPVPLPHVNVLDSAGNTVYEFDYVPG